MTITIDIDEAGARLSELLAKVEAGEEVVIARASAPVVRMTKVQDRTEADRARIRQAVEEIKAARANRTPTTVEEILAWKEEGRR